MLQGVYFLKLLFLCSLYFTVIVFRNCTPFLVVQGLYDIGHGTVLDSGTTFTYLPSQAYDQLHTRVSSYALAHGLHTVPGPDPHFQDTCFGGAPSVEQSAELGKVFPSLELRFEVTDFSYCTSDSMYNTLWPTLVCSTNASITARMRCLV